jgi:hypothetical protein
MTTLTDQKVKKGLVVHGSYSGVASCRIKISAIFRGVFEIFRGIKKKKGQVTGASECGNEPSGAMK